MTISHTPPIAWHAELRPDAYGKKLYITMSGGDQLADYERREHLVSKIHTVRDYLDAEGSAGRERHCTIDHYAMEHSPNSVVVLGNLHDLEDLRDHFDGTKKATQAQTPLWERPVNDASIHVAQPTSRITQRSHLRLVVSNNDVQSASRNAP